jgi:hypothetical protein
MTLLLLFIMTFRELSASNIQKKGIAQQLWEVKRIVRLDDNRF